MTCDNLLEPCPQCKSTQHHIPQGPEGPKSGYSLEHYLKIKMFDRSSQTVKLLHNTECQFMRYIDPVRENSQEQ